ncbi:hypothetical protein GPECTOR_46g256 [Gonium pectorale]|uniref:Uncharacterized protein n=1 Tax=Gonium pectorale TaxID=33097 RepID=A0A150G8L5_GONPE|nr:hypothetical protein GPECTOR_46g256 [Gonium pectorale]|eukprot:KXZ46187.1 hypothetical protein GPECTOR_46g256 [Gonium pectorale]
MLFSFDAMTFMKADQFNYGLKKGEYERYFRPLADRRTYYVAGKEEAEADEAAAARTAGLAILVVIVAPLLAVAGLALKGH